MKTFYCGHCGYLAFFENTVCGNCGSALGFVPDEMDVGAFVVETDGRWRRLGGPHGDAHAWRPCRNYAVERVCNWMVEGAAGQLCCSCRHTEITPALRSAANRERWRRLEGAKRRLFYSLYQLGLPVPQRGGDGGLGFRFVEGDAWHPHVAPDRGSGVVTLNLAEADDARPARRLVHRHEPYRTVLGHLRHAVGHFYWDRLIAGSPRLDPFRARFGDERRDYAEAAAAFERDGPPPDWAERRISAYAAMHPLEDWAETWAHYLHVIDALDTAAHWGFALHSDQDDGGPADLPGLAGTDLPFREVLIEQWLPLSQFLDSMGRSFGEGDIYPFVIAPAVLDKLCFVNDVVAASRVGGTCGYGTDEGADAESAEAADAAKRTLPGPESPTAADAGSAIPGVPPAAGEMSGAEDRGRRRGEGRRDHGDEGAAG
ncbi:zinc-binding metallopeptidase family protein [Aromatoleum sp.]|uniref:zinc-binding metallopeptidase family protein n=1 Tax=Aromatoleum sp. TaxID=2307007 RepID=UPI002FC69B4D